MKVLILFLILLLIFCLFSKNHENFLIDEIEHVLRTDPPCLLSDKMIDNYNKNGKDYCSVLSEKVCNKCYNNCKWENDKCIKNNDEKNVSGTSYCKNNCPKSCKNSNGWDITEDDCAKCKDCGWCIDSNWDGTCIKPDTDLPDNRPSKCVRGWEYQCVDYGPSEYIPPSRKCYMGMHNPEAADDFAGYNQYGCELYDAYQTCIDNDCGSKGKCFGLIAGNPSTYGCVTCTGSQKNDCLAPPDEGGAGCPGKTIPLKPTYENNYTVCKYKPS